MATQLRLRRHQIKDLEAIRDLSPEALNNLVSELGGLERTFLRPKSLVEAVAEILSDGKDAAEKIVRQILSIHSGLLRRGGLSIDEVCKGISSGIDREAEWNEEQKQKWESVEPQFRKLILSRAVRLVATAIDLSYEYAHLLRRARIITDIRPLYDENATKIEGAVVSHTLRLRYDSAGNDCELSIAMDESDIKELAEQCDRALRKARIARDLTMGASIPTMVSGESDDA